MKKEKKNKLSIYLIKEDVSIDDIIIQDSDLEIQEINGAKLYIKPSKNKQPKWVANFFGSILKKQRNVFSSMPCAALVVPVKINEKKKRFFALIFGTGYHLLKKRGARRTFWLEGCLKLR